MMSRKRSIIGTVVVMESLVIYNSRIEHPPSTRLHPWPGALTNLSEDDTDTNSSGNLSRWASSIDVGTSLSPSMSSWSVFVLVLCWLHRRQTLLSQIAILNNYADAMGDIHLISCLMIITCWWCWCGHETISIDEFRVFLCWYCADCTGDYCLELYSIIMSMWWWCQCGHETTTVTVFIVSIILWVELHRMLWLHEMQQSTYW